MNSVVVLAQTNARRQTNHVDMDQRRPLSLRTEMGINVTDLNRIHSHELISPDLLTVAVLLSSAQVNSGDL